MLQQGGGVELHPGHEGPGRPVGTQLGDLQRGEALAGEVSERGEHGAARGRLEGEQGGGGGDKGTSRTNKLSSTYQLPSNIILLKVPVMT